MQQTEDLELLLKIDGVGPILAERLLDHFGSGSKVARSACSGWNELTKVEGVSKDSAKSMFQRMIDAEVFHDLRGY